jgi:tRNA 2-thiouridine synthesizing protein A
VKLMDGGSELSVDLRGLSCPYLASEVKKRLSDVAPGSTLVVLCTDPLAAIDLPAVASELGHTATIGAKFEEHFEVRLCVGPAPPRYR